MHPNKAHFCATNKRSVTEFRSLSDKNPLLLLPQVLALSFKCHLEVLSLSVSASCALERPQRFVWESNILYKVIQLNDSAFANISAEKMDKTPESWADSPAGVYSTLAV